MRLHLVICVVAFNLAISNAELRQTLRALSALSESEISDVVNALKSCANDFSLNLYQASSRNRMRNFALSTYPTFEAMGMAALGAPDDIQNFILNYLQLPYSELEVYAGYRSIHSALKLSGRISSLFVHTGISHSGDVRIKSDYESILATVFRILPDRVPNLSPANVAYVNEISFSCPVTPQKNTDNLVFFNDGLWPRTIDRPIRVTGKYRYGEIPELDAKFVEIPCLDFDALEAHLGVEKNPENATTISMFIVLPNEDHGLDKLENNIRKLRVEKIFTSGVQDVDVLLPKIHSITMDELKNDLASMGLKKMFDDDTVYTNIADDDLDVKIESFWNNAFVNIEEIDYVSSIPSEVGADDSIKLQVNHPFISIITTNDTNPLIIGMARSDWF